MDKIEINAMQIGHRRRGRNSSIERVTRLHHYRVAWINAQDGWDVWVPAIVPRARLVAETFAPINTDCMRSHSNILLPESHLGRAYVQYQRVSTHGAHGTLRDTADVEQPSTPVVRAD